MVKLKILFLSSLIFSVSIVTPAPSSAGFWIPVIQGILSALASEGIVFGVTAVFDQAAQSQGTPQRLQHMTSSQLLSQIPNTAAFTEDEPGFQTSTRPNGVAMDTITRTASVPISGSSGFLGNVTLNWRPSTQREDGPYGATQQYVTVTSRAPSLTNTRSLAANQRLIAGVNLLPVDTGGSSLQIHGLAVIVEWALVEFRSNNTLVVLDSGHREDNILY